MTHHPASRCVFATHAARWQEQCLSAPRSSYQRPLRVFLSCFREPRKPGTEPTMVTSVTKVRLSSSTSACEG